MSARSAFYDAIIPVDHWLVTAPPGGIADGDVCLLAPSGCTGAFAGQDGCLAFYHAATTRYRFQTPSTSPGMRGIMMFSKASGGSQHQYFGHNGTTVIGPILTEQNAAKNASTLIAAEEFGD